MKYSIFQKKIFGSTRSRPRVATEKINLSPDPKYFSGRNLDPVAIDNTAYLLIDIQFVEEFPK